MAKEHILLLGNCGFERLVSFLDTEFDVTIAGIHDTHLIDALKPIFVYVDIFDWTVMTPLYSMAIAGKKYPLPISHLQKTVDSFHDSPVWFRGIRKPSGGAFGIWQSNWIVHEQLTTLENLVHDKRVIDIQALWARKGIYLDDILYGLGHGEAVLHPSPTKAAQVEAQIIRAIISSRSPIKCIVVDLDDTLIYGDITAEDFVSKNPVYSDKTNREDAWWRLKRGLHEALQIAKQRGIVLALASRNNLDFVRSHFVRRKDLGTDPASIAIEHIALDINDFQIVDIGFHEKSLSCQRIAATLGIGLDALAFLDNSPFEQEEVSHALPMIHVLKGKVEEFREQILCGDRFQPWYTEIAPKQRAASYDARRIVAAQKTEDLPMFLSGLNLNLTIRKAHTEERPRVLSLLQRTNQLVLTKEKTLPTIPHEIWVAYLQDRMADHGLIAVGVFILETESVQLHSWVCSCRVLPHRVAPSILYAMCGQYPFVDVHRDVLPKNGATTNLIEEAQQGIASWVHLKEAIPFSSSIHHKSPD